MHYLTRIVPATHMLGAFFDGARADLTKSMSMNPLFQVTHSFQLGSQVAPPSYNFGAVFGNENVGTLPLWQGTFTETRITPDIFAGKY